MRRAGGGFHGAETENITGLPTNTVDIYVAEVIIFGAVREFSFSPFLCWSSSSSFFHPSGVCVGGIKVVLLSSKLQISFASVHLTLCFITVARGATRFSSPPLQNNNSYQPLFRSSPVSSNTAITTPFSVVCSGGVGCWEMGIIFMVLALLGRVVTADREAGSGRM